MSNRMSEDIDALRDYYAEVLENDGPDVQVLAELAEAHANGEAEGWMQDRREEWGTA